MIQGIFIHSLKCSTTTIKCSFPIARLFQTTKYFQENVMQSIDLYMPDHTDDQHSAYPQTNRHKKHSFFDQTIVLHQYI